MSKDNLPKVTIDPTIAETVPTVVVSSPPSRSEKEPSHESSIVDLPFIIVRKIVNFFLDFLETTVVALSIFVVIYLFFVQPHEIKGNSMEPNFHNNEYILTDKISYRFHEPKRGDVVIFKAPENPDVDYIKRVIGLPGEKVKIHSGSVYVNDKKLEEVYLNDVTSVISGNTMQDNVDLIVPEDKYFVMGDNRQHSSDSRAFGPIPFNSIIGRAVMRYWPINEFGLVPKIIYAGN